MASALPKSSSRSAHHSASCPKSWAVTSGRDARLQIIYQVPEPFWPTIKTTKLRSSTKGEQLELRWAGCQSVVAGAHPITGAYRWLKDRSPADLPQLIAPSTLLQQMQRKQPDPAPLLRIPETDSTRARDFLDRIPAADADDYDTWVKVGMALHSAGDDSLLQDWIRWSAISGKFEPGICQAKWKTFNSTSGGVSLGTLAHLAGHEKSRPVITSDGLQKHPTHGSKSSLHHAPTSSSSSNQMSSYPSFASSFLLNCAGTSSPRRSS
jgi:hypothetical protein